MTDKCNKETRCYRAMARRLRAWLRPGSANSIGGRGLSERSEFRSPRKRDGGKGTRRATPGRQWFWVLLPKQKDLVVRGRHPAKKRRKKETSSAACATWKKIYFFFLAGAFFFAAFLAGAFFLAAFFAGAFFLAAFLAGAFFLAVANSLTSFQVFFETTSYSFITAKHKTLCASYACTQFFSIPFFRDTRLSIVARKNDVH